MKTFGNCVDCRFSVSFKDSYPKGFNHWGKDYGYEYVCRRFPPPAVSYQNPNANETLVKAAGGCYEYETKKETQKEGSYNDD
jgi:hypothetical protein